MATWLVVQCTQRRPRQSSSFFSPCSSERVQDTLMPLHFERPMIAVFAARGAERGVGRYCLNHRTATQLPLMNNQLNNFLGATSLFLNDQWTILYIFFPPCCSPENGWSFKWPFFNMLFWGHYTHNLLVVHCDRGCQGLELGSQMICSSKPRIFTSSPMALIGPSCCSDASYPANLPFSRTSNALVVWWNNQSNSKISTPF